MENKMIEMEAYEIDGIEYLLLEKLNSEDDTYLYLSNVDDPEDVMFRKIDKEDPEYIIPLDDENEVLKVIELFNESQKEKEN